MRTIGTAWLALETAQQVLQDHVERSLIQAGIRVSSRDMVMPTVLLFEGVYMVLPRELRRRAHWFMTLEEMLDRGLTIHVENRTLVCFMCCQQRFMLGLDPETNVEETYKLPDLWRDYIVSQIKGYIKNAKF